MKKTLVFVGIYLAIGIIVQMGQGEQTASKGTQILSILWWPLTLLKRR